MGTVRIRIIRFSRSIGVDTQRASDGYLLILIIRIIVKILIKNNIVFEVAHKNV